MDQLCNRGVNGHAGAFLGRRFDVRVVGQNPHTEGAGQLGNLAADTSQTEDAKRLTGQFAGLHMCLYIRLRRHLPSPLFHANIQAGYPAC